MSSDSPLPRKLSTIIERFVSLHLLYPTGQTIKHTVAALHSVHSPRALPSELYATFTQLSDVVRVMRGRFHGNEAARLGRGTPSYPYDPQQLPGETFSRAYGAEPPLSMDTAELAAVPTPVVPRCRCSHCSAYGL